MKFRALKLIVHAFRINLGFQHFTLYGLYEWLLIFYCICIPVVTRKTADLKDEKSSKVNEKFNKFILEFF